MATHQPMTVARIKRIASPRRTEEQSRGGLRAWSRSATMLAPASRVPARCTATATNDRGEGHDRHEGEGLGRGERLKLLHPAERGGPDQSVETHAGVGDAAAGRS